MSVYNPYQKPSKKRKADTSQTTNDIVAPESSVAALVIAAAPKAGMDQTDRARIDAIILRESGNSLYMQQQRRRDAKVNERIAEIKAKIAKNGWNQDMQDQAQREADQFLQPLLRQRPHRSTCVVIDMDMFFMACEQLKQPHLKDVPAVVGHGLISTSNYHARKFGVRSAMAGYIGDALVRELSEGKQELVHVSSHYDLYKEKSVQVRSVLREYDPQMRAYSLDEAFLQLGPYLARKLDHPSWPHEQIRDDLEKSQDKLENEHQNDTNGFYTSVQENSEDVDANSCLAFLGTFSNNFCLETTALILNDMRRRVCERTGGLTCSAGLAPNFMLAKIASDRNKPNGQCLVPPDEVVEFLHPLALRKVGGIGRVTEKICQAFGMQTVKNLYERRGMIRQIFTPSTADFLLRASVGASSFYSDDSSSSSDKGQKGISRERTFAPTADWHSLRSKLDEVVRKLSDDMQRKDLWAHNVTVKVKLHNYDVVSKARTLDRGLYVQKAEDLLKFSSALLCDIRDEFRGDNFSLRFLGIRCTGFRGDTSEDTKQGKLDAFLVSDSTSQVSNRGTASPVSKPPDSCPNTRPTCDTQKSVNCPLCGQLFLEEENLALNQHVDSCLSGAVVREVVREESQKPASRMSGQLDRFLISSDTN